MESRVLEAVHLSTVEQLCQDDLLLPHQNYSNSEF